MDDLNFYWRMGDYALKAVPIHLVHLDKDDKNETRELVRYFQSNDKECLYTIGYFYYNWREPCWELKFVGDRFKDLLETDVVAVFKMLKAAYDVLTEWSNGKNETD